MCKLLLALWEKRELFNSTYPLGNSGWDYGIYATLILNGFIKGGVSATRGIIMSKKQSDIASDYVRQLIKAVFYGVENNETH